MCITVQIQQIVERCRRTSQKNVSIKYQVKAEKYLNLNAKKSEYRTRKFKAGLFNSVLNLPKLWPHDHYYIRDYHYQIV